MLENEEEKRPSKRTWELVQKYTEALQYFGKPMNGMSKAELFSSLKESNTEEILEILDTIRQHEEQMEQIDRLKQFTGVTPQPPVVSGGTVWISDSTSPSPVEMTGITKSGTSIKLVDCPSPYKYQATGGKINE